MTTTITVETHDWPVAAEISDSHNFATPERRGWGHSGETKFMPAHSKEQFHITDTRNISFRELPKGAKSLDDDPRSCGDTACGTPTPIKVDEPEAEAIAHVPA